MINIKIKTSIDQTWLAELDASIIIKNIEKAGKIKTAQLDLGAFLREGREPRSSCTLPTPRKRVYREIDNRYGRSKEHFAEGLKTRLDFLDAAGKLVKLTDFVKTVVQSEWYLENVGGLF